MPPPLNFKPDPSIRCREFKIGCIGAGFIMADVQLLAYATAGFPVVAIASRRAGKAGESAQHWEIATLHTTPHPLIKKTKIEIVAIAFSPAPQPEVNRPAPLHKKVCAV